MVKEEFDLHTCNLALPGGYHGHPYPQKFVKHPDPNKRGPNNYQAEKCNPEEIMESFMK